MGSNADRKQPLEAVRERRKGPRKSRSRPSPFSAKLETLRDMFTVKRMLIN